MSKIILVAFSIVLLSQALTATLDSNAKERILKVINRNRFQKRDLANLLSKKAPVKFTNQIVNPLDVIPIPLKMEVPITAKAEEDHQIEQLSSSLKSGQNANADTTEAKLNELKQMYDQAISNMRTETIGSQTFLQKKAHLAEKQLEKMVRNVELIINNRVDLSFHSIQTKMNEAQNALNELSNKILGDLDVRVKTLESELVDQINTEKVDLEDKITSFNQNINLLSQRLIKLISISNATSTKSTTMTPSNAVVEASTPISTSKTTEKNTSSVKSLETAQTTDNARHAEAIQELTTPSSLSIETPTSPVVAVMNDVAYAEKEVELASFYQPRGSKSHKLNGDEEDDDEDEDDADESEDD